MSTWRCVQRGNGPAVLIYLCGQSPPLEAAIKAALPGIPVAVTGDSGYGAPASDIAAGLKACGATVLGCLGGYSAGCQGVRQQLWNAIKPPVVMCIDGTAGPWPLADNTRELQVWRDLIADCRAGHQTFVATCTMQRYTQRLVRTATQKQGPFAATSTVLSRVFDWPELEAAKPSSKPLVSYPGPAILEKHEIGVHVLAFNGTDCDNPAHSAQLTKVMPEMLAAYVAPALGLTVDVGAVLAPFRGFADAVAVGIKSIADIFGTDRDVHPLAPCGYRCSVAEKIADAKANKTWHPAGDGYVPKPGDMLCSARAGQEPENGGSGHVEGVVYWKDGVLWTAGGNENNTWALAPFDLKSPSYRGCIAVSPVIADRRVELMLAECGATPRIAEIPGAGANKRIQMYHAGARRKGSAMAGMPGHEAEGVAVLGANASDEIHWCASSQSWVTFTAIRDVLS